MRSNDVTSSNEINDEQLTFFTTLHQILLSWSHFVELIDQEDSAQ